MEQVEREHERAGSLKIGVTVPNSIRYQLLNGVPVRPRVTRSQFSGGRQTPYQRCPLLPFVFREIADADNEKLRREEISQLKCSASSEQLILTRSFYPGGKTAVFFTVP